MFAGLVAAALAATCINNVFAATPGEENLRIKGKIYVTYVCAHTTGILLIGDSTVTE